MAAVVECLPPPEAIRKGSPDHEADSGVDNTSESGVSCDDDLKHSCFSSTESLDVDPPFARTTSSIRSRVEEFIKNERITTVTVQEEDGTPVVHYRTPQTEESICVANTEIAVLELDTPAVTELFDDEPEIDLDRLPVYFQDLWLGKQVTTDFTVPLTSKPTWYDDEKFKRGQKFAQEHLFCINYAETVSLFLIFAMKSALQPLIFTERSGTPYKAFQRYLSTLTRIMSWYEGDPWSEGSASQRHMAAVRVMHRNVQQRLTAAPKEELRRRTALSGGPIWSTARPVLLEDFRSACPMPAPGVCPHVGTGVWVNQFDMAVTQFAFVGLVVTYPQRFGIHYASPEDLDAFLHMWRALGHLLGIHDKYNYCNADLETVQQRTHDFINLALKPSLREVTPDWEHMCRCLVRGIAFYVPGFSFDVSLKYLCTILKVHTPRLTKSLSLWQSFMYRVVDVTFSVFCRVPGLLSMYNMLMLRAIRRAQEASPETLRKWEQTEFPYMKEVERGPEVKSGKIEIISDSSIINHL